MLRRWTSSFMDVPSTVHPPAGWVLDDYPSYSLFLVSSAYYILLFIAWCVYGGRGGLLFICAFRRVNIWWLFSKSFTYYPPPAASIGYPTTLPLAILLGLLYYIIYLCYMSVCCPSSAVYSRFTLVRSLYWVLGFCGVRPGYCCVGDDRWANSSASLAQCCSCGGFFPSFAIFALVWGLNFFLRNFRFYS